MTARAIALSTLVCAALVVAGRYGFGVSWQNALVLAPLLVVCAGGIAFLLVLWGKVIYDSVTGRGRREPE